MAEAQTSKKLATQRFESARVLSSLPFQGDDKKLVEALCNGHPGAAAHLHARFAPQRIRVLFRLLGPDSELEDAVHDTFVQALRSIYSILQKLQPDERISVTLRFVEGMTLPEAAAASGLSLSTFKRRLAR